MRKSLFAPVALVAASAVVFAAAPGALATSHTPISVVRITAKKSGLAYTTKTATAKAGRVKIVFTNLSPLKHNVKLEQGETEIGNTRTITAGTTTVTLALKKGVYHFYCSVPGHEAAGMSGFLKVS